MAFLGFGGVGNDSGPHSLTSERSHKTARWHGDRSGTACQIVLMQTGSTPDAKPCVHDHERRSHARRRMSAIAIFRERGRSRADIRVTDLSPLGCRVRLEGVLVCGEHGWVTLPTLAPWSCAVAWRSEEEAGVTFERPLHQAVAEMIATRHEKA